jgi:hypothetical protein
LGDALVEGASEAGVGGLFLQVQWYLSGTLVVHVPVDADAGVVGDLIERAVALASEHYRVQLAETADRERRRELVQTRLEALVVSARTDPTLFGKVRVIDDQWLGTLGWLAALEIRAEGSGREELTQTHDIFANHRAAFQNLHVRDDEIAFSVSDITGEFEDALRSAIADAEQQARHVRKIRAQQAHAYQQFAAEFHGRFGPLPDP